jgi:hypothetical protein
VTQPIQDTIQDTLHETSMAVWDVHVPVVVGTSTVVRAGVRCSRGCRLSGRFIQISDAGGNLVGEGRLGDAPLEGTDALYWTEISVKAPATQSVAQYRATFTETVAELGHDSATTTFTRRVTGPPEHQVSIDVVDKQTGIGVSEVEVRFGHYNEVTDRLGRVQIAVPGGTYDLSIRKDGFGAVPGEVTVAGDMTVRIEGMSGPTMAEIAPRMTAFEGFPWG